MHRVCWGRPRVCVYLWYGICRMWPSNAKILWSKFSMKLIFFTIGMCKELIPHHGKTLTYLHYNSFEIEFQKLPEHIRTHITLFGENDGRIDRFEFIPNISEQMAKEVSGLYENSPIFKKKRSWPMQK